ncbi:MAG: hypothetical protein K6F91_02630 [Ruminococcus sp.]|nr:hypothetical protein [Ruminococcus sp.]
MGFFRKLFGLPDENDFDSMYQVKYDHNDYDPVPANSVQADSYTAADSYTYANEGNFMFTVEDVFTIKNRGTVVTGVIESGNISIGDTVTLNGKKKGGKYTVAGIESFRKAIQSASMGDNVGLFLTEIKKEELCRGDKLYR